MDPIEGVDYAWSGPSAAALKAAGKRFACRYGGPGSDGKQLHAAELKALTDAGISVVANAEGSAGGFSGRTAGRSWATSARDHFRALGMPATRPIYFSADWDVTTAQLAGVDAALQGAAEIIGAAQVGVYGSYRVIEHCRAAGSARWFWQTYAWSGGQRSSAAHLYQYRNGVTIGGADCDLNRAYQADYGQWGYQEDDVALDSSDKAWLSAEFKKQAIAAIADQRDEIARGVLVDARITGTETGAGSTYQRNAADILGDLWAVVMRGNTRGGDPVPPAGAFGTLGGKMEQMLSYAAAEAAEVPPTAEQTAAAVVQALGSPGVDLSRLAELLRNAVGDRAGELAALLLRG